MLPGEGTGECSIDPSEDNQKPFLLLSKSTRSGSRKRKGIPIKKRHGPATKIAAIDEEPSATTSALSPEAEEYSVADVDGVVEEVVDGNVSEGAEYEGEVVDGEVVVGGGEPNPMELAMSVISDEINISSQME